MTIKNLYPKARPQAIYNVINGRPELPADSKFSRASEATYVDANGIIQTAGVEEPRVNYDPVTGERLGLLLEKSAINVRRGSNDFNNNTYWFQGSQVTMTPGYPSPNGGADAYLYKQIAPCTSNKSRWATRPLAGSVPQGRYIYSFFCKLKDSAAENIVGFKFTTNSYSYTPATSKGYIDIQFTFNSSGVPTSQDTEHGGYKHVGDGWYRVWMYVYSDSGLDGSYMSLSVGKEISAAPATYGSFYIYGVQLETTDTVDSEPTSYITTSGSAVPREADAFSLTSSPNFDGGFSLLLDSDTTTDDYFYKIKASGTTIAALNNASGTLDWVINGVSAATNGEYPQISAIQPGRVRTVSSFGAADGTTQQNYLYTEGLSFPTNAVVASGADEIEFGPGQTLKAVYLWNGQLSDTEAVSVIKGEYNIVPDEPIKADSYSFVYNTDPTTVGEATITLPYIVPTVSMRVYWGDGSNSAYGQGVTPSHTYPYPGQYRIQIEADDGFDAVRLGDATNSIYRVDQWAPQHRVGATGDGFTGSDLFKILATQVECVLIPPFKYTGLTDLNQAFYNCQKAAVNNWDWIPTNLQSATDLSSAFTSVSRITMSLAERSTFPQLQTGTALASVAECFRFNTFTQFDQGNSGLPFSNTQNVTDWSGCFRDLTSLTAIGALDTSAATTLSSTFNGCSNLAVMPFIATNDVTDFSNAWYYCESLTSFPQIDTSKGTDFTSAFEGCSNLTSFPLIDLSKAAILQNCFWGCTSLTSIPLLNTSSCTTFSGAFNLCSQVTSMPLIDTSKGIQFSDCFREMTNLTNMPLLDMSNGTTFESCWNACTSLVNFPAIDMPSATSIRYAWSNCSNLGSFSAIDLTSCTDFYAAWRSCSSLTNFPANMFDTTGTLTSSAFGDTWSGCALTAQSIENILVSVDANGQSNIVLGIDAGTNAGQSTWTAAANTAYTNLINKGWTITFNP